jgi:flagellin
LTVADVNQESTNLVTLQTRQQLALQSLSIATSSEQSVLRLFH